MKNRFLIFSLISLFSRGIFASPGDTTTIQTFTFGSPQDGWFQFPNDSIQYNRIYMYYTLRCVPGNNPSCGEWDYLTYTYLYDHTGAMDSNIVAIDTVLNDTTWNVYEVVNRFELGRYITPYGFGLDLTANGWTWIYDVTDYRTLLADSVHLSAGNWQEQLDMKFVFIEGEPARDVHSISNIWSGGHNYDATLETNFLTPKTVRWDSNDVQAMLRIRNTGHGFGGTYNCSEFCPRNNFIKVDGNVEFNQYLWRNDCGLNPLYPQGGTWLYDRANWCPGAEVREDDYELQPWITAGDSSILDYDMQAGYVWDGQGSTPYYVIEAQLFTFGACNYTDNVSLEKIISPNNTHLMRRYNPVCDNPLIVIRNNGQATLTNVEIAYGPYGAAPEFYSWLGNLEFLESDTVALPPFQDQTIFNSDSFEVTLLTPNGNTDEFPYDDSRIVGMTPAPVFDSVVVVAVLTNAGVGHTAWTIEDENGNIIHSSGTLAINTFFSDTLHFGNGCYKFTITDTAKDGLNFFANTDGNGFVGLRNAAGQPYLQINPNFGTRTTVYFVVNEALTSMETAVVGASPVIFPVPSQEKFWIQKNDWNSAPIQVNIYDVSGRKIFEKCDSQNSSGVIQIDWGNVQSGLYWVEMISGQKKFYLKQIKF